MCAIKSFRVESGTRDLVLSDLNSVSCFGERISGGSRLRLQSADVVGWKWRFSLDFKVRTGSFAEYRSVCSSCFSRYFDKFEPNWREFRQSGVLRMF
jgi:hypothetical protein